jgi:hypothetical protein
MANTYTLINSNTVGSGGAASVTFSSIPATYTDLLVVASARSSVDGDTIYLRFNSNTSSYSARQLFGSGASASSNTPGETDIGICGYTTTTTASTFGNLSVYVPNYASSNNKSWSCDSVQEANVTSTVYSNLVAGRWANTAAITAFTMGAKTGSFNQYSTFYLYGIKNS